MTSSPRVGGTWARACVTEMLPCDHARVMASVLHRAMARVLVIDADGGTRARLVHALAEAGHDVEGASSATTGVLVTRSSRPDAILFDLEIEGGGPELCAELRGAAEGTRIAILAISGAIDEATRVAAFEAGIDDFVAKPYSLREVVLRVRALTRTRRSIVPPDVLSLGDLRLDRAARKVTIDRRDVPLTRRELDLLLFFLERVDRVQSRDALIAAVWADGTESPRVVDTTVKRLRQKLGGLGDRIQTIRGVGYRLLADGRSR